MFAIPTTIKLVFVIPTTIKIVTDVVVMEITFIIIPEVTGKVFLSGVGVAQQTPVTVTITVAAVTITTITITAATITAATITAIKAIQVSAVAAGL